MKKKLIAIVASLAMVATMVPASAFAMSVEWSKDNDITTKTKARLSMETGYKDASTEVASLKMTAFGTKSKAEGWLPYATLSNEGEDKVFGTAEGDTGHYADITFDVPTEKVEGSDVTNWVMIRPSVEHDYKPTGNIEKGPFVDPYTVWRLNSAVKTTNTPISSTIRVDDYNGLFEAQILYVDASWDPTLGGTLDADRNANTVLFADIANLPDGANNNKLYPISKLEEVKTSQADNVKAVANLSIDFSNVLLLSKTDTKDLTDLKTLADRVTADARNGIDKTYCRDVEALEKAYNELSADAKSAVKFSVDNDTNDDADQAYTILETGQKNVEAYNQLTDVANLIKAIPAWKAEYVNDDAIVAQVEAAVKAEKKLNDLSPVVASMLEDYLTTAESKNYADAKKDISSKDVSIVIAKIDALQTLTGDFDSQAAVEAIAAPLKDARAAYDDLGDQKTNVTNVTKLTKAESDYNKAIKKYVNPIWAELYDIDVTAGLKPEERAKVAELKSYIDNEYLDTALLEKPAFDKKVYNKLVEALNGATENIYSLEKATVEAIADQSYTGKAIKPAIVVKDGEGNEIAAENYYVSYDNNLEVGEATVTIVAKAASDYYGEATATFTIKPAALTADMVKVANATYTGKAVKPAVSVASGVDYTVAYKNNTAVGKASAVVTGTGNYMGTITKYFIVKPAKESITSLKAGKKQITVAYKAQTGAKYRVICKASGLKAVGTNTTATKKTVKKLKSGKTYQVKVRAYKAVDGKTYYGTYSAVKKVKVK